jgi:hypothetical protein
MVYVCVDGCFSVCVFKHLFCLLLKVVVVDSWQRNSIPPVCVCVCVCELYMFVSSALGQY